MKNTTEVMLNRVAAEMVRVARFIREDTIEALAAQDHVVGILHYVKVRNAVDTIKKAREALDEIADNLSKQSIPDLLRSHNIKNIKIEGVGTVGISNKVNASIIDKPRGFEWLRANGAGSLITEVVNASSLSAHAKSLLQEGEELPDDIFKVSTMTYTSIRK